MVKVSSTKYKDMGILGNSCVAFTGFFKHETMDDKIEFVKVWNVEGTRSVLSLNHNTLMGAVLGGVVGAVAMSLLNSRSITLVCTIFLKDGNYFSVETNEKDLIRYLLQFATTGRKYHVNGRCI